MKHFPLGDTPSASETGGAPFNDRFFPATFGTRSVGFGAVATSEFRAPRRGEWYLSGAVVCAYKAPNDIPTPFRIAKLVRVARSVSTTTTTTVLPISEEA
jgi:hypothetical protein